MDRNQQDILILFKLNTLMLGILFILFMYDFCFQWDITEFLWILLLHLVQLLYHLFFKSWKFNLIQITRLWQQPYNINTGLEGHSY